ncbi:MAG: putative manganese-dependent inorganic diphosphatase [Candidatus Gastranaerophilales bacterium]|nr:putative manganese-dependent inorganic diphosphatase [Candidatus Gastranaerophilales bacterium]
MINPITKFPRYNISFCSNKTYVIGHKNPDSDSVCSAIGVAHLQSQLKPQKEYQPIAAGDINAETAFALAYFGIEQPKVKEDVSLTVKQAMPKQALSDVSVRKNSTIREFIDLVMDKDIKTAAVLNDNGTIAGVVSRKSLAEFLIRPIDHLKQLKEFDVSYETIKKLIDAEVITGSLSLNDTIKGDIQTGAYSVETLEELDLKEGIVVVGDRYDIQKSAIENGAKALIISRESQVDSDIIELAKENNVIILSTKYGIAKVTSLLEQATPVSHIMSASVASLDSKQKINEALNLVKNTKFGYFPVLENDKFIGIISREEILAPDNNGIILVDHNNPSQFAKGVDKDDIEGVIDHHVQQLVLDSSRVPIMYMPVGATATLVARNYKANGIEIPKDIAGILWCAIVSDTDKFTSVTTTLEDVKIANELAQIAQITQPEVLANKLLAQRDANLEGLTSEELVKQDLKILQTKTKVPFCVSQIKTYQSEKYIKNKEEIEEVLNALDRENSTSGSVLMITDLSQNATFLLFSDKIREAVHKVKELNNEQFLSKQIYQSPLTYKNALIAMQNNRIILRIPNVQSRKEQIQPFISQLVELAN